MNISFSNQVPENGFKWATVSRADIEGGYSGRRELIQEPGRTIYVKPIEQNKTLYSDFAALQPVSKVRPSEEAILRFANKYGLLEQLKGYSFGERKVRGRQGEDYVSWVQNIMLMREAVDLWGMAKHKKIKKLSEAFVVSDNKVLYKGLQYGESAIKQAGYGVWRGSRGATSGRNLIERAKFLVHMTINENLQDRGILVFSPESSKQSKPELSFVLDSLLAAMWYQFATAIVDDRNFTECERCGRWFEARKRGGLFCSDNCRQRNFQELRAKTSRKETKTK